MTEIFKGLLEDKFFSNIYNPVHSYVANNYEKLNLQSKTYRVNGVLRANVNNLDVIKVASFSEDNQGINFSTFVRGNIVVKDIFDNHEIEEEVLQWFCLKCSATLEYAEIKDITVESIEVYNK